MHIDSTVLSGVGVPDDIAYLLEGHRRVLFVSDANIVKIPGVQRLLAQVRGIAAEVRLIADVPPEPSDEDVRAIVAGRGLDGLDLALDVQRLIRNLPGSVTGDDIEGVYRRLVS